MSEMQPPNMNAMQPYDPRPLRRLLLCWLLASGAVLAQSANDEATRATARRSPVIHTTAVDDALAAKNTTDATSANVVKPSALPPLPEGVAELKFSEFYRQPVGPRGLEFTDKLRGLNGRRVRILGYMVHQEQPVPHCLLLAPLPVKLGEEEYGFCEDMPATVLHVFTDASTTGEVAFTPGLLLLTGRLSVGNRTEPDGRISTVRLQLDMPSSEQCQALSTTNSAVQSASPSVNASH